LENTPSPSSGLTVNLQQLLKAMVEQGASDLHITTGSPPQLRIDGVLVPLRVNQLSPVDTKQLCYSVLTDTQKLRFEEDKELDFSFGVRGVARFRANLFMQRGAVGGAFRTVPFQVKSFGDLGLPPVIEELCNKPRGMVLVTGPTGSGKTTSLAAMIDKINSERHEHIITIEDPIEYLHPHKKCLINQREIGADTDTFKKALKYILRQDPDVVLIGEMRDLETIEAALVTAETGHLCFATLHTNSAVQTINRIIDVFPPSQQSQIRAQLSFVLEGIISQVALAARFGTRPGSRARGDDSECGYSQSHPRGQDPPDLFHHADRTGQVRYADHEPKLGQLVPAPVGLPGRGDGPQLRAGRAGANHFNGGTSPGRPAGRPMGRG
jgi:twitching motility protein PilT